MAHPTVTSFVSYAPLNFSVRKIAFGSVGHASSHSPHRMQLRRWTVGFRFRFRVRPAWDTSRSLATISMHSVGHTIAHFEQPMHFSSRTSMRPRQPSGISIRWNGYGSVAGLPRRRPENSPTGVAGPPAQPPRPPPGARGAGGRAGP